MKTLYLAHPYGGDRRNLAFAARWALWLSTRYECYLICPWLFECISEDETPERRAQKLPESRTVCNACDVAGLCGPITTPGVAYETRDHRCKVDLTTLGLEYPPSNHFPEALRKADALMAAAGIERRHHNGR